MGLKKEVFNFRSVNDMVIAPANTGNDINQLNAPKIEEIPAR